MKAEKESTITLRMNNPEANVLARCVSRILDKEIYIDVLPDNENTKQTLENLIVALRPLI